MVIIDCMGYFRRLVLALTYYYVRKLYSIGFHFLRYVNWDSFSKILRISVLFETMALSLHIVIAMNLTKCRSLQHCGYETVYWLFLGSQNNEWIPKARYFCLDRCCTSLIYLFLAKKAVGLKVSKMIWHFKSWETCLVNNRNSGLFHRPKHFVDNLCSYLTKREVKDSMSINTRYLEQAKPDTQIFSALSTIWYTCS